MKLRNDTRYPSAVLRELVREVYRRLAKTEGPLPTWRGIPVGVGYTRQARGLTGWSAYAGTRVRLRLHRGTVEAGDVARLVEHELVHAYGHRHEAFCTAAGYYRPEHRARFRWADERWGVLSEVRPVLSAFTAAERRARKLAAAVEALARWERRLKLATTKAKKYRLRVRALERSTVAAVAAAPKRRN